MLHRRILRQGIPAGVKVSRPDSDGYSTAVIGTKTVHCKKLADGTIRQVSSTWFWRARTDGKLKDRPTGCSEKVAAMSVVAGWERQAELVKAGLITPKEIEQSNRPEKPLAEAVAEYLAHQKAKGISRVHCANTKSFLERVIRETKAGAVEELMDNLPAWRDARIGELSSRNISAHVAAAVSMVRWLAETCRCDPRLVRPIRKPKPDAVRPRRSFTPEEVERIIQTAPPARRLIYRSLQMTGLRVNELRSLQVTDFDPKRSRILLPGNKSKNRRSAIIPIPNQLCFELQACIKGRSTGPLLNVPKGLIKRFDGDLKRAGVAKRDTNGKTVDLHSFRKTYITAVVRSGADPRTAMELARHSDSRMTLGVYAEPDQKVAVEIIDRTFGDIAGDTLDDLQMTQNGQKAGHGKCLDDTSKFSVNCLSSRTLVQSGREDLNLRPLAPHASALARLRYAPISL
jgi:integrase